MFFSNEIAPFRLTDNFFFRLQILAVRAVRLLLRHLSGQKALLSELQRILGNVRELMNEEELLRIRVRHLAFQGCFIVEPVIYQALVDEETRDWEILQCKIAEIF